MVKELVLDLLLIVALGFFGSFGHCVGMCSPLTVALALSAGDRPGTWKFHLLLNLGRLVSYGLVGAALGSLGSVVVAGGQLAGIGSNLRQAMAILTGILLIWCGLVQVKPQWLPALPYINPLQGEIHQRLNSGMNLLAGDSKQWTPLLLGGIWGLIPCGFLYTAQLKAVETGSLIMGALTMLAFGLGTAPALLGVGISASRLSADRRSQLFRVGGWITIVIGILMLWRTDAMVDYTGHSALILLILALVARPVSGLWSSLLIYRRVLGVGAFILALAHTAHMIDHSFNWNWQAIAFMLPQHRWGLFLGIFSLILMLPATITSTDHLQKILGRQWRRLHLLTVPGLILAVGHTVLLGSHYLGSLQLAGIHKWRAVSILSIGAMVLLLRSGWCWRILGQQKSYMPPKS